MKQTLKGIPLWLPMAALALLGLVGRHVHAQTSANTPQERAAISVVENWWATWQSGDHDKVAAMVSDDIEFQGLPSQPLGRGRDAFREHIARLNPKAVRVTEAFAVGGTDGTAVLTKRLLTLSIGGKDVIRPVAALVVVRDSKIVEWIDFPLTGPATRAPRAASQPAGSP